MLEKKITDMLAAILDVCTKDELNEVLPVPVDQDEDSVEIRKNALKKKIMAVGRMAKVFKTLREEREVITELKNIMGVDSLPAGSLQAGAEGLKQAIVSFEEARKADLWNEKLPPMMNGGEHAPTPAAPVFGERVASPESPTAPPVRANTAPKIKF